MPMARVLLASRRQSALQLQKKAAPNLREASTVSPFEYSSQCPTA